MEKEKIIEMAASVLGVDFDVAKAHCKDIPELCAYYFWNPVRGGIAVIVNENGEKLGAISSVSYERHVEAFLSGKRN